MRVLIPISAMALLLSGCAHSDPPKLKEPSDHQRRVPINKTYPPEAQTGFLHE